MRIVFEPAAQYDLAEIIDWISKDKPRAARALISRIEMKVMRLAEPGLADMGRLGFVEGTRELIEYPYIIVYRVDERDDVITVIAIVHGARER